jgi:hypothetical protein
MNDRFSAPLSPALNGQSSSSRDKLGRRPRSRFCTGNPRPSLTNQRMHGPRAPRVSLRLSSWAGKVMCARSLFAGATTWFLRRACRRGGWPRWITVATSAAGVRRRQAFARTDGRPTAGRPQDRWAASYLQTCSMRVERRAKMERRFDSPDDASRWPRPGWMPIPLGADSPPQFCSSRHWRSCYSPGRRPADDRPSPQQVQTDYRGVCLTNRRW